MNNFSPLGVALGVWDKVLTKATNGFAARSV